MNTMLRDEIKKLVERATKELYKEEADVKMERPSEKEFGDLSTNVAMILKKNPKEIADFIKSDILEKIEIRNGFINFFLSEEILRKQVVEILRQKNKFGESKIGKGKKVNIEFISANPTGPLTLGNGRGGFCGDVLANALKGAGFKIEREYYINDTGEQVRKLGHSVLGDKEAVYKGQYIEDLRLKIKERDILKTGEKASEIILKEMIVPSVKKMKINFDTWFSEKSLHKKGEIKKSLDFLKKENLTYENEGALWFKSSQFGDDKDRVLIKADGETTYLASDIAYLKNKFLRGFEKLIFFWGADHFGYIERIKAAAVALGHKREQIDIIIMQLVKLFQGGQEVRMSKRTGIYITMDELIDEVGLDTARFFFLSRAPNTHLDFDMDLAKEQSEKNPVYYIQYAHARICSIFEKIKDLKFKASDSNLLTHKSELGLIKQLIRFPEIIEDTAKDYQIQRIPQYAVDLATSFHAFYRDCRVISEDKNLTKARMSLLFATQIVLKNTLNLMGISAPEKM